MKWRLAFEVDAAHGEGALWDWRTGLLVSVHVGAGRVLLSDPRDGSTRSIEVGQPVGAVLLEGERALLLAVQDGFASLDPATEEIGQRVAVEVDRPESRMNDAACDPRGRCFAGTMAFDCTPGAGTLYRLDHDRSVHAVLDGFAISNGIGWDPSGSLMYHIDSLTGGIDVYDFDLDGGVPSARRRLVDTDTAWGLPDGLAIDAEGGIWVAFWDGSAVRRFGPAGELTATIELPAARPTRPAFGGERLDRLYVTTAKLDPGDDAPGDRGGAIFVVEPGVHGVPASVFGA